MKLFRLPGPSDVLRADGVTKAAVVINELVKRQPYYGES